MKPQLQKKVNFAIKLLQNAAQFYPDIELCYSGGKDSDVILELAKMAKIPFTPIYKNTTIDPPGTIAHVIEKGVQIVRPKKTFFQLIENRGVPSRFARFCCAELKEYKIKDAAILGIRREESRARSERYKEPEMCRVYSKTENVHQILPILDWTSEDVLEFINERGIKLAPVYYRADGSINIKQRLGCLGCPMQSIKARVEEFKKHPKFLRQYIKRTKIWWEKKPRAAAEKCDDVYEMFAHYVFGGGYGKRVLNKEALFKTDYKKALEGFFNIKL